MFLPKFDIIRGTAIDYMHQVLLGIIKCFVHLWFDSANKHHPANITKHTTQVNKRLSAIKPPNRVTRVPISLTDISHFKASEWRSFLFLYSLPCLYGILPDEYFQHYLLLVEAMFILLSASISVSELSRAKNLLRYFCVKIKPLYGARYESSNMHLLLHLVDKVKYIGPLWTTSLFYFEDSNGELRRHFRGTQGVASQIIQGVCLQLKIPMLAGKLLSGTAANNLYGKLSQVTARQNIREKNSDGLYVVGASEFFKPKGLEKHTILGQLRFKELFKFKRLFKNGQIFHSEEYKCCLKRNSFTVSFKFQETEMFGHVLHYFKASIYCLNGILCSHLCQCKEEKYFALMRKLSIKDLCFSSDKITNAAVPFIIPVHLTTRLICIPVTNINELCVFIPMEKDFVVVKFPNNFEKD